MRYCVCGFMLYICKINRFCHGELESFRLRQAQADTKNCYNSRLGLEKIEKVFWQTIALSDFKITAIILLIISVL